MAAGLRIGCHLDFKMKVGASKFWRTVAWICVVIGLWTAELRGIGAQQQLSVGYYNSVCPQAEAIVRSTVTSHFIRNRNIAPQIVRMHFHDCAVTGCDASLLLNGTQSEQRAGPNLSVAGYDVVNDAKGQLEAQCAGTVSCSDIIALATRDAISLTNGMNYSVPTGRFDAKFSAGVNATLPSPSISVNSAILTFGDLGLNIQDMVLLMGAHTIGTAACSSFNNRLFNFNNTGRPDPTIGPLFLASLQNNCPVNFSSNTRVALDLNSPFSFDGHFYRSLIKNHGVLSIDQELSHHPLTKGFVSLYAKNSTLFVSSFANSIVKMGTIGIVGPRAGEIRRRCYVTNSGSAG